MAERKMTVLNPAGYQEVLQTTDNVVISASPVSGAHATNKTYVDTSITTAISSINLDGDYVNQDGDNMVGDLTLGPVGNIKITFDATTGSADFLGDLTVGGEADFTGDANFTGDVTADAFFGDGSGLTNLPVVNGLWIQSGNDISPIASNSDLTGITDITISGNFVATGTIDGESIDGGTWS